ncbi:helix-turn-helix transcriptional regulator [Pseudoalteromonas phenolica]|uniref:helix-turn-helix transcriptional regulator n=1 Tax=Pseudoalteromonas phenolica TaxID=161398 RepID=UPI00110A38D4|nr:helix-turn-helix transcriptional regulator [Pseudoalteromonas phenolica]TMO53842.1 hypothetical protein CWC21_17320 [Pseudoalteromonas phenolica]
MSNTFSHRLKEVRLFMGMNQIEFAKFVDIPVPSYRKYETGDREPLLNVIQKLISKEELKPHAYWLITGEKQEEEKQLENPNKVAFKPLGTFESFEQAFVTETVKSIETFAYLDWINLNTDKIDLSACGKLLFKEVQPIIESYYSKTKKKEAV